MIVPFPISILLVDEDGSSDVSLRRSLEPEGHVCFWVSSLETARAHLDRYPVHLVLCGVQLPDGSGRELIRYLAPRRPETCTLMLTSSEDLTEAIEGVAEGALGYITRPIVRREASIQIAHALHCRQLELERLGAREALEHRIQGQTEEVRASREELAMRLMTACAFRFGNTGAHVRRIGLYVVRIAEQLGWSGDAIDQLRIAASLHDVGKIGIPDALLQKPGRPTTAEWELIKTHTVLGHSLLGGSGVPLIQMAAQVALHHHEHWNGRGYPRGLKGTEIPVEARIVSIGDVYDGLSHAQAYKPAWPEPDVVRFFLEQRGEQFDPELVDLFLERLGDFRAIRLAHPDEPELRLKWR